MQKWTRGAALGLGILLAGCATGNLRTTEGPENRRPSRRGDVLTIQEIRERAPSIQYALDAIRQLRNEWVRGVLGTRSFQEDATIRVYLDNISVAQGPEWLRSFPVERIIELRYFRPTDATQRWGTGHALGAIEVVTVGQRPLSRPEPDAEPGGTPVMAPLSVHDIRFAWSAYGNAAVLASPQELSDVWDPDVSAGFSIGVTATPNVTVSAGLDLHRFRFSESGAVKYLATRGRGRFTTLQGAVISGEETVSFNASARIKLHAAEGRVRPFMLGSVGYGRMDVGAFSVTAEDGGPLPRSQFPMGTARGGDQVENTFTVGVGGGIDAAILPRLRLFVDATYLYTVRGPRYEDVFNQFQLNNTSFFPVRFGLSY